MEWNACIDFYVFSYSFYRWTFNNSAEAKEVEKHFIRTNGTTSLLTFTPTRTLEYGTLMCWSRNSVGEQRDPCIFHIIAAGNFQHFMKFLFAFPYCYSMIERLWAVSTSKKDLSTFSRGSGFSLEHKNSSQQSWCIWILHGNDFVKLYISQSLGVSVILRLLHQVWPMRAA